MPRKPPSWRAMHHRQVSPQSPNPDPARSPPQNPPRRLSATRARWWRAQYGWLPDPARRGDPDNWQWPPAIFQSRCAARGLPPCAPPSALRHPPWLAWKVPRQAGHSHQRRPASRAHHCRAIPTGFPDKASASDVQDHHSPRLARQASAPRSRSRNACRNNYDRCAKDRHQYDKSSPDPQPRAAYPAHTPTRIRKAPCVPANRAPASPENPQHYATRRKGQGVLRSAPKHPPHPFPQAPPLDKASVRIAER